MSARAADWETYVGAQYASGVESFCECREKEMALRAPPFEIYAHGIRPAPRVSDIARLMIKRPQLLSRAAAAQASRITLTASSTLRPVEAGYCRLIASAGRCEPLGRAPGARAYR